MKIIANRAVKTVGTVRYNRVLSPIAKFHINRTVAVVDTAFRYDISSKKGQTGSQRLMYKV